MTDLNTYVNANRTHYHRGAQIKKLETLNVKMRAVNAHLPKYKDRVLVTYHIYAKDFRKDEDNLLIYIKWINDGLVDAGVIPSDSPRYLRIKEIKVLYDSKPRVEVDINPEL